MKIATLESNQLESDILQGMIVNAGHECTAFSTGKSLLDALQYKMFDLLIMEWHLSDMKGNDVIRAIRNGKRKNMMVMVLTDCILEVDIVLGLEAGANYYVTKPIGAPELSARIYAVSKIAPRPLIKRSKTIKPMLDSLDVGYYHFDLIHGIVTLHGHPVDLQPKEFDVAVLLFSHAGQVVSREKIMSEVWGRSVMTTFRTLDTHISRVRAKLKVNPDNKVSLVTIRTIGYKLDAFE